MRKFRKVKGGVMAEGVGSDFSYDLEGFAS